MFSKLCCSLGSPLGIIMGEMRGTDVFQLSSLLEQLLNFSRSCFLEGSAGLVFSDSVVFSRVLLSPVAFLPLEVRYEERGERGTGAAWPFVLGDLVAVVVLLGEGESLMCTVLDLDDVMLSVTGDNSREELESLEEEDKMRGYELSLDGIIL